MTWQGVSEAECYDNRSVIAQIVRIKDRLTAVEQNVDPTLRTDLEAAIAELTALENTVANVQTAVGTNAGNIEDLQEDLDALSTSTTAALALKADAADVDADLELKADKTQLTDGSVTMLGTDDVGRDNDSSLGKPVVLVGGVPRAMSREVLDKTNDASISGLFHFSYGLKEYIRGVNESNKTDLWIKAGSYTHASNNLIARFLVGGSVRSEGMTTCIIEVASCYSGAIAKEEHATDASGSIAIEEVKVMSGPSSVDEIYVRFSKTAGPVATMSRMSCVPFVTAKFTGGAPAESITYDDIVIDGIHYPNIVNFQAYAWTQLSSSMKWISR